MASEVDLDHRPGRGLGCLHLAWNVRLRPPGMLERPRSGCWRRRSGSSRSGSPSGGCRAGRARRASRWASRPVSSRRLFHPAVAAYRRGDLSVVCPVPGGPHRCWRCSSGVVVLGERLGVAGSIGVVMLLAGFLVLQRPWRAIALARSGGGAAGAEPPRQHLFALATGVMIATLQRSTGRHPTDRVTPYAAILWRRVRWRWCCECVRGRRRPVALRAKAARRAAVGGWPTLPRTCASRRADIGAAVGCRAAAGSATVFAAAWGSVRLGEASDRSERLDGSNLGVVVGEALLLAVGG